MRWLKHGNWNWWHLRIKNRFGNCWRHLGFEYWFSSGDAPGHNLPVIWSFVSLIRRSKKKLTPYAATLYMKQYKFQFEFKPSEPRFQFVYVTFSYLGLIEIYEASSAWMFMKFIIDVIERAVSDPADEATRNMVAKISHAGATYQT